MMHEWWEGWGPGLGGMGFGPMIWLVLLTLLIIGIVAFRGRPSKSRETSASRSSTPRQILSERFARGEIDKDEYQDRLSLLRD